MLRVLRSRKPVLLPVSRRQLHVESTPFLSCIYPPFAPVGAPATHPCLLPTKPGTFRDNINGIMFTHTPRDLLHSSFEALYNLDLQWEGRGDQWITLQGLMTLEPQDPTQHPPHIRLRLADKRPKHTSTHQFLMRHAPKARTTLRSLVPALSQNSAYYRNSHEDATANISLITHDLPSKGYPNVSWKPLLRTHLHNWGLEHYTPDE